MRGALLVLLVLAPALGAGCIGDEAPPPSTENDGAERPGGGTNGLPPPPRNASSSGKRWHFHNYWGASDNITLFDAAVGIDPDVAVVGDRPRLGMGEFAPADGRIVPPETGRITVEVTWNGTLPERPLRLLYRAANMTEFLVAGPLSSGPAEVTVVEAMADAAHTGASGWAFRVEAMPDEQGLAVANGSVHVRALAWLGRPIIIDPPHRDHWQGRSVLDLGGAYFQGRAAKTAQGVVLQNGTETTTAPSLLGLVPPNGTLVPEGAKSIVVRLTWTPTAPLPVEPSFLVLWSEGQTSTSGVAEVEAATPGAATYRVLVDAKATDSPYTTRSTWRIDVQLPDDRPAFDGVVTARAWAGRALDFVPE